MSLNPHLIVTNWLSACTSALTGRDVDALTELFLPDGWMRDWLVFTWDIRSLEGRSKISSYIAPSLSGAAPVDIRLDESVDLSPRTIILDASQDTSAVEFVFTFQCARGPGRALVRLLSDPSDGNYRALSVFFQLRELRGHEESRILPHRDELTGTPGRDMGQAFEEYVKEVETKPYALIVGCGQTGLQVAARFKQMDIPTVTIERHSRVGDGWRKRYPSLTLHTVKEHHALLYQPFPGNWPQFTPRDKLADWFETYSTNQDLIVWTNTTLQPHPKYDADRQEWDVTVIRDGVEVKLRPAHIVLATGTLGEPNVPALLDRELFRGQVLHSGAYGGGAQFAGKRAVVVGAGNSSIDVCQDLVLQGVESVTMVQRSATCVISRALAVTRQRAAFPPDVPTEVCDLRFTAWPLGLLKRLSIANQQATWDSEREMHGKLRRAGLKLTMGPEGEGHELMVYGRLGGYWLDKGGADLIDQGKIKVRSGVSPQKFTKSGLVMSDGTELLADVIIFATGYLNIRDVNKALFGEDVIGKTDQVWGLDSEGEINGSYRPSGHPGLWFATGDFMTSRALSKVLAIQLKAIQVGLLNHNGRRNGQLVSKL